MLVPVFSEDFYRIENIPFKPSDQKILFTTSVNYSVCVLMEIKFSNQKLQKICENQRSANRELGQSSAKKLRTRISDIIAAQNVFDLPAGNPHQLKGNRIGQYSLSLSDGKRLVFIPANNPTPLDDDDSIDWSRVTKVCIIEIGNYHD